MSDIFIKNENVYDGSLMLPCVAFADLRCPYDVKCFVRDWIDDALQFRFNEITIERYSKTSDRMYVSLRFTNDPCFNKDSLQAISKFIEREIEYVVENPKLKLDCVFVNLNVIGR